MIEKLVIYYPHTTHLINQRRLCQRSENLSYIYSKFTLIKLDLITAARRHLMSLS
jgi:hypothetical protein